MRINKILKFVGIIWKLFEVFKIISLIKKTINFITKIRLRNVNFVISYIELETQNVLFDFNVTLFYTLFLFLISLNISTILTKYTAAFLDSIFSFVCDINATEIIYLSRVVCQFVNIVFDLEKFSNKTDN